MANKSKEEVITFIFTCRKTLQYWAEIRQAPLKELSFLAKFSIGKFLVNDPNS
jgi:hypothetical protein